MQKIQQEGPTCKNASLSKIASPTQKMKCTMMEFTKFYPIYICHMPHLEQWCKGDKHLKYAFEKDLKIKKKKEKVFSGQGKKNEEGCFWPRALKPTEMKPTAPVGTATATGAPLVSHSTKQNKKRGRLLRWPGFEPLTTQRTPRFERHCASETFLSGNARQTR